MSEKRQSEDQSAKKVCDFSPDSELKELKVLTNNPSYVCMECGKSASNHENLCKPERMYSSW
jgi:hypothetical protein